MKVYEIKAPIVREGAKRHWLRIGSATECEGEFGPMILCTIESTPLNWDGVFALFPKEKK